MSDPKLVTVKYGKKQFELGLTLYNFTFQILGRNEHRRLPLIRPEIELHWSWQIMSTYPNSDDPMRIFLLEQVCFWSLERRPSLGTAR